LKNQKDSEIDFTQKVVIGGDFNCEMENQSIEGQVFIKNNLLNSYFTLETQKNLRLPTFRKFKVIIDHFFYSSKSF
jgi:hypothetical protein